MTKLLHFPEYDRAERAADAVIHFIGVPLGFAASGWLLARAVGQGGAAGIAGAAIYVFGLVGMLTASAAYNLTPKGMAKERLRRLDRAMIFVMIAGTYTPVCIGVLLGHGGAVLCAVMWLLAATGVLLSLAYPRRFERSGMVLYLVMGWMLLILLKACVSVLPFAVLALIVAGGIAYSVGAVVQAISRLKFHNPAWHALILLAASLHYAAISLQLTGSIL